MAQKPAFIRWSDDREAQIQSRLLDVLSARFRRKIAAAIQEESTRVVTVYEQVGFVPAASDQALRAFRDVYLDLAEASARTFGQRILTQGKAAGYDLETKQFSFAEFFRSLALSWVNQEPIRRRIQSVTETTREQIVNMVARGQRDGLGQSAIASDIIERVPSIARRRAEVIARTETHGAANFSMHQTAKQTGLDLVKKWVATEDMRTRSIARDDAFDHVAMDGQTRPMDEPFDMPWVGGAGEPLKIMYPGEAGHPGGATINCLPPWALVRLAGIKRVMRSEYSGDLFEFSFAGPVNFTVTANHPVLTLSGWKAARHVVEGDQLVYSLLGNDFPSRINADVKNRHARIDQLYDALKPLGSAMRASAGTVDFHGDMPNSDVDIVTAHGKLRDAMITEGRHLFGDINLTDTHIAKGFLLASRMLGLSDLGSTNHSNGIMGVLGSGNAGFGRGHCGLPSVSLADVGSFNVHVSQATVDHFARNIEGFGDRVDAVPLLEHSINLGQEALPNDAPSRVLRPFQAVEVTAVKRFHYAGPVYNCETDTGLIVSDGVVNHNCRCAVVHKVLGLD